MQQIRQDLHALWCYVMIVVDFLVPPRCLASGRVVDHQGMIAPESWAELGFVIEPYCSVCGIPFEFHKESEGIQDIVCAPCLNGNNQFDLARSALVYNDVSRKLVLGFKHGDQPHATRVFTPLLMKAGAAFFSQADIFVPVPLHRWRLMGRRYNQAALLGWALKKETGILHVPDMLKRTRATKSQGHMKYKERAKNVRKAIKVRSRYKKSLSGKNVILLDDVYTTGATVNECAKALKQAGAARVDVLTIARVVKA